MEGVFGSWWNSNKNKKAIENIRLEQNALIDEMIKNKKFDPNIKIDENIKEQIKTAHHIFQDTLLAFNSKEFWDTKNKVPNKKWQKKIKDALKILIKYDVMSLETIASALRNTFATSTQMTVENYNASMNHIMADLEHYMTVEIAEEKAKIQKLQEIEIIRKEQEKINRETEEKRKIELEEQEKQEAIRQKEQEKNIADKRFKELKVEWERLLNQIAHYDFITPEETNEFNNTITKKALRNTKEMLGLTSFVMSENKKAIVEKHIADFSNALVSQQKRNPDKGIIIHHYIELFNVNVHTVEINK